MNKKIDESIAESILIRLKAKEINYNTASILLGISKRQIYKLKKRFSSKGTLINKIKPPLNKTPKGIANKIINLYKTKYKGFSHTHFFEKLTSIEKIEINFKTLQRILNSNYLISPYAQKKTKRILKQKLENNKIDNNLSNAEVENIENVLIMDSSEIHNRYKHIEDFGALLQLDARSDFYIEKEKWNLHLCIDVGTGIFVGAYFDKEETLNGYQHVLHQICTKYGIPKCILTDNRTVFEYLNKNSKQESKNTLIQFKFSCINLGIKLQTTSVATYKGIIERGNGTFGRRLPQELKLNKIKTIEEANKFLIPFLSEMNHKFAKTFTYKSVFRKSPDIETLNNLISNVARRIFDKACCVKFQNEFYYATIENKIVAFKNKTKCLFIKTFDNRFLISVDSIPYVAKKINDMKSFYEKEANPEGYNYINDNKVNSDEFVAYNLKHKSNWNYNSFQKYLNRELLLMEENFYK